MKRLEEILTRNWCASFNIKVLKAIFTTFKNNLNHLNNLKIIAEHTRESWKYLSETKNSFLLKSLANYSYCFVYAHIEYSQNKETKESERFAIPWESVVN